MPYRVCEWTKERDNELVKRLYNATDNDTPMAICKEESLLRSCLIASSSLPIFVGYLGVMKDTAGM